jgi:coenzyme F420-dependent glucose-6-phosphate dehydrogenase
LELGYKLCSEERSATQLVSDAAMAEEVGFGFAAISDHYHPWLDAQGQSPFVWGVLGAIATRTRTIEVGTAVTCPTMRMQPSIVAQAAATAASLLEGRFFLGLGTGENLNEHIGAEAWPSAEIRRDMLEEAIEVIRALWQGEFYSHQGLFFTVDRARVYSLPDVAPPIYVAAGGKQAATLAGARGDGLMATAPEREIVDTFTASGGAGKPRIGELTLCYGKEADEARHLLRTVWPMPAIPGELSSELPLPRHFEQAAKLVDDEALGQIVVGPDPESFREAIALYEKAGFDRLILHQVGPDQEGFLRFASDHLIT